MSPVDSPTRLRFLATQLIHGHANDGDLSEAGFKLAQLADRLERRILWQYRCLNHDMAIRVETVEQQGKGCILESAATPCRIVPLYYDEAEIIEGRKNGCSEITPAIEAKVQERFRRAAEEHVTVQCEGTRRDVDGSGYRCPLQLRTDGKTLCGRCEMAIEEYGIEQRWPTE